MHYGYCQTYSNETIRNLYHYRSGKMPVKNQLTEITKKYLKSRSQVNHIQNQIRIKLCICPAVFPLLVQKVNLIGPSSSIHPLGQYGV